MKLIEHLNWRYATKIFDPTQKVSDEDIRLIKEAIRLSVSSYGLQMYKVLIIENKVMRNKLRSYSWDQSQITDASHLFVFCNYTQRHCEHVDEYIDRIAYTQMINSDGLKGYGDFIKADIKKKTREELKAWSEKQTYLALNNLLIACAELKIDACPMEGFDNEAYNELLGLDQLDLHAAVIAPVGYRSVEDETQFRKKVRKSSEALFMSI